ncbi:hypothetical protein B0J12DRAFT_3821 [Macrophomina phaseolina]|uniref:RING-type domain-containing protein n=1 Tax=Macrophomina phaseolina TaxID=35725 RepID=A0ABQ8GTL1_9PEZI|nr:hypothetical protein B0J12DRAFT_3821 [Macrophomina phaseolina]
MTLHPTAWLLVRLIDAEETFEDELTYWHVEEEHMRKRIFTLDDKNFARLLPSRQAVRVWDEYEPEILDTLREIQDNARRNFDFRLLRDWGRGRAFKKLDLVIDTKGKELLELSIDGVLEKFNNFGKLSFDLFGCHPIKLKDALEGSDECCPVCLEDWVDGDVRVTTHCNHQYHPACIFGTWDLPGHFGFVCPKCRGEGLRVLGRINIPLDRIAKVNDEDLYRFSEDGLAWFNSMVDLAKTWEDDPDQEYNGVEAGDWIDMPGELWTAWAKSIRRELVQQNLTDSPQELTEKRPDPTASWPWLDPNPVNRAPPADGVNASLSNMSIDDDEVL